MIYLIIAQIARGAVVWTTNRMARKILKTVTIGAVTFYLVKRHKSIREREERNKR